MDRRLRLGIELTATTTTIDAAANAEEAGLDTVWLPEDPRYDPFPLMGAIAQATSSIGLGIIAFLATGRHPAILARELTALDVVSNGRSLLMMIDEEPERLGEAAGICRALFTREKTTIIGRHYRVVGAVNRPRPPQRAGLPIVVSLPVAGPPVAEAAVVHDHPELLGPVRERFGLPVVWRGDIGEAEAAREAGVDGLVLQGVTDVDVARAMLER